MVMGNMQMLTHNVTMVIPSTTFSGDAMFHAMQREHATTLYGSLGDTDGVGRHISLTRNTIELYNSIAENI